MNHREKGVKTTREIVTVSVTKTAGRERAQRMNDGKEIMKKVEI